jgi:hypothetical protein
MLFRATRDTLSTGDALQVAIDMNDEDVSQEINAGADRLRGFFDNVGKRLNGALDAIDWSESE